MIFQKLVTSILLLLHLNLRHIKPLMKNIIIFSHYAIIIIFILNKNEAKTKANVETTKHPHY